MPKWDAHGSKVKGRQASPGGDRAGVFTEHVHKFGHSYHTEVRTVLWKSIKLDFSGFGATLVCPWVPPRHVCNVCAADRRVLLTYSLMPFRRGGGRLVGGAEGPSHETVEKPSVLPGSKPPGGAGMTPVTCRCWCELSHRYSTVPYCAICSKTPPQFPCFESVSSEHSSTRQPSFSRTQLPYSSPLPQ